MLGQIITVGIMATVFILALKYVGKKWNLPVVTAVSNAV